MKNSHGTVPGGTAARDHSEDVASILSRPATELRLMWDLGNISLPGRMSHPLVPSAWAAGGGAVPEGVALPEWWHGGREAGQGHHRGGDLEQAAVGAVAADELEADRETGGGQAGRHRNRRVRAHRDP